MRSCSSFAAIPFQDFRSPLLEPSSSASTNDPGQRRIGLVAEADFEPEGSVVRLTRRKRPLSRLGMARKLHWGAGNRGKGTFRQIATVA